MPLRQLGVATLALLGVANGASSCCFVVQDEAREVYWTKYVADIYTIVINLTSITTILTVYPTTTITNYETNVYPTTEVFTTSSLVTENPVSLYPNPAYEFPQNTEVLAASAPVATGGVTIASPTGFWVYSTAKVFAAPAVTDPSGNVACGTLSSFSDVASDASACVPTFTGINSNAAAYFDSNGGQGVIISLTTPFVHIPTRTALEVSPSEACAQGNGIENYGYPVQELINHLAGNAFYSAQYPGIENCIPAGPSIKAVEALAVSVTAGAAASLSVDLGVNPQSVNAVVGSTETPGGGLGPTGSTTTTVTSTGLTFSNNGSSSVTSTSVASGLTSSTLTTSSVTALAESTSIPSSTVSGAETETPVSGGLLPGSPSSTSSSSTASTTSGSIISPFSEVLSSAPPSTQTSSQSTTTTSTAPTTSQTSSQTTTTTSTASTTSSTSLSTTIPEALSEVNSVITGSLGGNSSGVLGPSPSLFTETTVPLSAHSTGVITGSPTLTLPVTSYSVKEYIPWELIIGLIGFVSIRVW